MSFYAGANEEKSNHAESNPRARARNSIKSLALEWFAHARLILNYFLPRAYKMNPYQVEHSRTREEYR